VLRALLEFAVTEIMEELLLLMQREGVTLLPQLLDQMDRPVSGDNVEPAVVVVVEERRAESGERDARRRHADLDAAVLEESVAAIDEQRALFVRQVGEEDVFRAVAVEVRHVDTHAGRDAVHVHRAAATLPLLLNAVLLVDPQLIRIAVVRYIQVRQP
jgi:hypothetical protein